MRTPLTHDAGKQRLASRIAALMPTRVYLEPFAGGALSPAPQGCG